MFCKFALELNISSSSIINIRIRSTEKLLIEKVLTSNRDTGQKQ